MNEIFYVYTYLRSIDSENGLFGSPYYMGTGCNNRAFAKRITTRRTKNGGKY